MLLDAVRRLTPVERFHYWIQEREAVRLKKEAGQPPPWTDDPILQSYRFTNVRRMDDKVSRWLLDHWYRPFRDHPHLLVAAALARFFNQPRTLAEITDLVFAPRVEWTKIKRRVVRLRDGGGGPIFNAAYMVRGNDGPDKITSVVDHNVRPLTRDPPAVDSASLERTWTALAARYGFGSFMAGQVVADLRWAVTGEWADRDRWAPLGPGSRRGLNRLLGRPPETPVTQPQFEQELVTVMHGCLDVLPPTLTVRLEAMDYQNCLCEYDKACRAWFDEGRPKQLYRNGNPRKS